MDSMKITSNFSSPSNTEGLSKEPCEKEIKEEIVERYDDGKIKKLIKGIYI